VSSDGSAKILSGNYADRASQITLTGTGLSNECLALSPDEKKAAIGTNGGGLVFIELENRGDVIYQDTDNGKIVLFLKNLGNTGSFVSGGTENRILKWNYNTYEATELTATASRLSALSATNDGRKVAYGTRDGKLMELNVASPQDVKTLSEFGRNHVMSIAYAPGGKTMVVGLVDGSLRVLSGGRVLKSLSGPGARVTDIAYSPDGRFIVAASHDGKVYLWNTSDWNNPPIVFDENNGFVLAVCFSSDGKHFYSGSVDYPRFIGRPTESSLMAGQFCSLLSRNLTREEWVQFFGSEIPYEKTCPGLN
jgi:WD40 repeat protein